MQKFRQNPSLDFILAVLYNENRKMPLLCKKSAPQGKYFKGESYEKENPESGSDPLHAA